MKIQKWLRASVILSVLFLTAAVTVSCKKNKTEHTRYRISGNADGSQEVPSVTTSGTATLTGTYNADSNMLHYNINYSGLSGMVVAAHIHGPALAGSIADAIHPLVVSGTDTSGVLTGSIQLADSTERHLLDGKLYYNLHTADHSNGEIRGQISTARY